VKRKAKGKQTTVVYERERSLERVRQPSNLRELHRHQDIHEGAIKSLEDFQHKAVIVAAKLEKRGSLSRDLARQLRWLTKRLQKSMDAGTPRMDLYLALGAGLAFGAAQTELRDLAPPENRGRKIETPEHYHAAVRELESSGVKPTSERIAGCLNVTPEAVRKWRKRHLAREERTAPAKG
jgi:lambda repressor-like predicted transcriptional regulator